MIVADDTKTTNSVLVDHIFTELEGVSVAEFIVCPGGRNTPIVEKLIKANKKIYYWPEERSAGFFALGRSKLINKPVVVCTTSGTAVGELLPVVMEAYYTNVPLILMTADRPKRFRGSGAPQSAEQKNIFGPYTAYAKDIDLNDHLDLTLWDKTGPCHLNVCLEEPNPSQTKIILPRQKAILENSLLEALEKFMQQNRYPLVVVSTIPVEAKESVIQFLNEYDAPVYLEGISHLRNEPSLEHLKIYRTDNLWNAAKKSNYPIDSILRIGGVPTFRLWRDLEEKSEIDVLSISEQNFSGLSSGIVYQTNLSEFFSLFEFEYKNNQDKSSWIESDRLYKEKLIKILNKYPSAESSLVYQLSKQIKDNSMVYLGNSLPIRQWDMCASNEPQSLSVYANRGLNGIDGQISTFLGMCCSERDNFGIFGDLTTIYDLAAPWILQAMQDICLNIVVINNGGGKIFDRMFPFKEIQNLHHVNFEHFAKLWNMSYMQCKELSQKLDLNNHQLIEIIPSELETCLFYNDLQKI